MTDSLSLSAISRLSAKLDQLAMDMAGGFEAVTSKLAGIEERVAGLDTRMAAMEAWATDTTARMSGVSRWMPPLPPPRPPKPRPAP
jgi:hypothetical protein